MEGTEKKQNNVVFVIEKWARERLAVKSKEKQTR